ncbi:MAG: redox-regulated ATPase YchF [Candidatus Niyogibacteria bacterium CG10_big_fil_rev_8_21_14_0_10_42_19]|uniref:Redox-regulated ATPase YchF n=1 Tax=Candidatus Niyogibacteria bacterium CG10_big_fil_rev_8_21_14_0_10_42_19 TaxID=1974725 RepID=A0A2H0TGJ2_9BACT|nr:MAG: redox-regulated ATPase YchF [Candidatus Niyogibacteria bacterium CG10_big_fil_rev_8_21_14_0_10_42_19]
MLKIGIIGLPNVGKSTLFQALTKKQVDTSNYPFATIDPNVGVVNVPDERLQKLSKFSNSKKTVETYIEFIDIAGLIKGAASGEGLGNKFLTHIREVDAICHIVRAFKNENIHHVSGIPDPISDILTIKTELALKDLETVTKAKEKTSKEARTGNKEAVETHKNYEKIEQMLEQASSTPITLDPKEMPIETRELISFKPVLYVFNISSRDNLESPKLENSLALDIGQENDISAMSEEEKKELNISSSLQELIRKAYELLGLITYFTTGEDESRAWTIPKNSTAKRAGRAIHSDFEEKFIRAEIIHWEKLLLAGSWKNARERGLIRTEGKEYIVQDGDVIEFKI